MLYRLGHVKNYFLCKTQRNVYKQLALKCLMKEEASEKGHGGNSCGVVGVVFGIMSLIFFLMPIFAVILAIIGLIFSFRQRKNIPNSWSTAGLWLNGVGLLIGVVWNILWVREVWNYFTSPQYLETQRQLQQLQGLQGAASGA